MSLKISCICSSQSIKNSDDDLILCTCCAHYSHFSCYSLSQQSVLSLTAPFLCIVCRMILHHPFLEITDIIVKPYILPQKKHIEQYQKFELSFPQSNDIRNEIKRLNFMAARVEPLNLNIEWPTENLFFWVNNRTLEFDRKGLGDIPWKSLRNCNEFNICCLEGLDHKTVFVMFLTRNRDVGELLQLISQRSLLKNYSNYRENFQGIIRNQKVKAFRIRDVFSGKRMQMPGRGRYCTHLDCFDIENYLIMNGNQNLDQKLRWRCPICRNLVLWNELDVDLYAKEILVLIEKKQISEGGFVAFDEFFYWEVYHGDEGVLEERMLENSNDAGRFVRATFPEKEKQIRKFLENKRLSETLLKFKSFYSESAIKGFLPLEKINKFPDLLDFSEDEFYYFLKACGLLKPFYQAAKENRFFSSQKNLRSLKNSSVYEFYRQSYSGLIVNIAFFWAKSLKQVFRLCSRLMCKNMKTFPDVLLAMELMLLFSNQIKYEGLERNLGLPSNELVGGILGTLLSFFVEEYNYQESKVGKMLFLLWNNVLEFGLSDSVNQGNYKDRIEEISELIVNFTSKWSFKEFENFLLEFFEPPKQLRNKEIQMTQSKIMAQFFTLLLKKKTNLGVQKDEIRDFLKKWDREGTMDGVLTP